VIVADTLTRLGLDWEYEKLLANPTSPKDFRLPDFTVGVMGDICYWEHLGMLTVPAYLGAQAPLVPGYAGYTSSR